jgi:uncharacterized protein YaiI (UPF0178 family)
MIYIDADACPVREECYRVAERHNVPVVVVSNSYLRIPKHPLFSAAVVDDSFDAADDYIAERANSLSVVITSDILLAQRCLMAGARVLAASGKAFDNDSIGSAIAARAIMADLRAGAEQPNLGGPAPFSARDRSRFLEALHLALERLKRGIIGTP